MEKTTSYRHERAANDRKSIGNTIVQLRGYVCSGLMRIGTDCRVDLLRSETNRQEENRWQL
jgi:hypothetical protein